ncbi:MAG: hypothetical protein FWD09_02450 [Lentimicrobiaceae bacterium]|nr:hypothetical protein [Lentimicrobiaceae bacterium]
MDYQPQNFPPTIEGLRASIEASNRYLTEKFAETDRLMKETDRQMKETDRQMKETDKKFAALNKQLGGISNSNGAAAESYFINSFMKSMEFAGQKYDSIDSNFKRKVKSLNLQGEYDLALYNCTSVVIIEIKYKADETDVDDLLEKAPIFKQLYPQYTNLDLYLGLAALHFSKGVEKKSKQQGIAVIKQVGENMVIYDDRLRVF